MSAIWTEEDVHVAINSLALSDDAACKSLKLLLDACGHQGMPHNESIRQAALRAGLMKTLLNHFCSPTSKGCRLLGFSVLCRIAYGSPDTAVVVARDSESLKLLRRILTEALNTNINPGLEPLYALIMMSDLLSVSMELHDSMAPWAIPTAAGMLTYPLKAIANVAAEVLLQFAANPRHRSRVRASLRPKDADKLLRTLDVGRPTSGLFALKLIYCHMCAHSAWKAGLHRLLEDGLASELEAALQASIEQQEYPSGCGVRPLAAKLAKLLRRLAQHGYFRHFSPQLVSLIAALARGHDHVELHAVSVDGVSACDAACQAVVAAFKSADPSKLREFATAAGVKEFDPELPVLDVGAAMTGLGISLEDYDVMDSDMEADENASTTSEQEPSTDTDAFSHPLLTPEELADLLVRELTPEDYEMLLRLDEGVQRRPGYTADVSSVGALPERPVEANEAGSKCAVCFEAFVLGEPVKRLRCTHMFHAACLTAWLVQTSNACPICNIQAI